MTRKQWVLITISLAVIHGVLTGLLTPIFGDIVFSRFDGNPYDSPWDPLLVGLYLLLNLPYLLVIYSPLPLHLFPPAFYLLWVGNSLAWGLMGAWLISKLPFMKNQDLTQ